MERILVTGATGQLGKEVVNLLLKKMKPENISGLVRDLTKAEAFKSAGVIVHKGDYMDYKALVKAFSGADKLYFISTNDFSNREIQHENVVKAAIEAKVKHIIYTSFQRRNDSQNSPISFISNVHVYTEKLIKESGLTYTILKHGLYSDFLPVILGDKVMESGQIYLPAGNANVAFTLRSDLAEGGVAVLLGKGHENKSYEFCAETTYSFFQIADLLSKKDKKVKYISPTNDEYKAVLKAAGTPEIYINVSSM